MIILLLWSYHPQKRVKSSPKAGGSGKDIATLDISSGYNTYTTQNGIEINIPTAFTNKEQENDYHNFIIVLAEVLMKYGADISAVKQ